MPAPTVVGLIPTELEAIPIDYRPFIVSEALGKEADVLVNTSRGWVSVAEAGPEGPQGPEGPPGEPGLEGPKGDTGSPGVSSEVYEQVEEPVSAGLGAIWITP